LFLQLSSERIELDVIGLNERVLGTLKEGDLVEFDRGIFSHWGVYVGMYQCPMSSCRISILLALFSHLIRIVFNKLFSVNAI